MDLCSDHLDTDEALYLAPAEDQLGLGDVMSSQRLGSSRLDDAEAGELLSGAGEDSVPRLEAESLLDSLIMPFVCPHSRPSGRLIKAGARAEAGGAGGSTLGG